MSFYYRKQWWKILLLFLAMLIGISSLYYTNLLVEKLSREEKMRVELWADATKQLAKAELTDTDLGFLLQVIQNNRTVPVILVDSADKVLSFRNLDSIKSLNEDYVKGQLELMKKENKVIPVEISKNLKNYIYYRDSYLLFQLMYYPYFQLGIIILFIVVAYFAFSSSRKAEQNQVWVGLTKETAHQLGTPTSSLLAWKEVLKEKDIEPEMIHDFEKDIERLEIITDRFSKIGSKPTLKVVNIVDVIDQAISYLKNRVTNRIQFVFDMPKEPVLIPISSTLFSWVIENICKNSVDAIQDSGKITISLKQQKKKVIIDITDTGKGLPKSKYKTIFKPGYTTKTRGWGLGLSLAKRIVQNFHEGKIFVLTSEVGKGTTIRIILKNQL